MVVYVVVLVFGPNIVCNIKEQSSAQDCVHQIHLEMLLELLDGYAAAGCHRNRKVHQQKTCDVGGGPQYLRAAL